MTESSYTPPQTPRKVTADRQMVQAVYILYLIGIVFSLTALVGVILAYANRDQAEPVSRSHFNTQIALFWWGLLWCVVGGALVLVYGLGGLVLLGWVVWLIINVVKGMSSLGRGESFGTKPVQVRSPSPHGFSSAPEGPPSLTPQPPPKPLIVTKP